MGIFFDLLAVGVGVVLFKTFYWDMLVQPKIDSLKEYGKDLNKTFDERTIK